MREVINFKRCRRRVGLLDDLFKSVNRPLQYYGSRMLLPCNVAPKAALMVFFLVPKSRSGSCLFSRCTITLAFALVCERKFVTDNKNLYCAPITMDGTFCVCRCWWRPLMASKSLVMASKSLVMFSKFAVALSFGSTGSTNQEYFNLRPPPP